MKKIVFVVVFMAAVALASPLFAQKVSPEHSSEYFYENTTVEKVYPTMFGYILIYRKGMEEPRIYIPNDWFSAAAGKAELITLPPGQNWPSVTVYYKNGEFSHVRLYVHRWRGHPSWGNIPLPVNSQIGPLFENINTIKIER